MSGRLTTARSLHERFCPNTGAPLEVGEIWPPRLILHRVVTTPRVEGRGARSAQVWVRHVLPRSVEVRLRASDEPAVDDEGLTHDGLQIQPSGGHVAPTTRPVGVPLAPDESPAPDFHPVPLRVRWTDRFALAIDRKRWVRKIVIVELTDGRVLRSFQWAVYLTPHAAEVPRFSSTDAQHPHFTWVDDSTGPLSLSGVARSWVEFPAPLSALDLPPACWVQPSDAPPRRGAGPQEVSLVPVFPVEPPPPRGLEPVGWRGALGGYDTPPTVQALAVDSHEADGIWVATLSFWDVHPDEAPGPAALTPSVVLEAPTPCVWPVVISGDDHALVLYDLASRGDGPCEVVVTFRVELPSHSEPVRLRHGVVRLGPEVVGAWQEAEVEVDATRPCALRCTVDLSRFREAPDGRLKLTLAVTGRPTRGVVAADTVFATDNGPYARLSRARGADGSVRTPWLVIDLGTEGTCAAVAFMDGFAPRVIGVGFEDGPIYPSRVYLSPALGGVYSLADEPTDDALYTTLIKLGLRFGDGAHPGCPDHIASTEVARFFLKRFLLEVRERMAWFPLADADVLVSFPPRLGAFPRFVRSLQDTFQSVLEEVLWRPGEPHALRFREEAFLVSVPMLHRDLQLDPVGPGHSRYYWVMDFGGGTTDVCGFLVQPDAYGEEHVVSRMTYPQRLPHHLSGNDVTRAFYGALYHHVCDAGLVTRPDDVEGVGDDGSRLPLPPDPFPTARSTATALVNQTALRELADAVKCLEPIHQDRTLRSVAQELGSTRMQQANGAEVTLVSLLSERARALGDAPAADLHAEVLDPTSRAIVASKTADESGRLDPASLAPVRCVSCDTDNHLPMWIFASNRTFRFRCRACAAAQRVQHTDAGVLPDTGDEQSPTLTAWAEHTVQQPAPDAQGGGEIDGELYLQQDGQTYVIKDHATLRRWVEERRVASTDLLSEDGMRWGPLGERAELSDLFRRADVLGVDTTQEVPKGRYRDMVYPEPGATTPVERPALGRDIRLFLTACREALERAVAGLDDPDNVEVVVLVAGRASQFRPIADGIHTFLPGRVVHLTNEWVRHAFGTGGKIDPSADLKTLTVNGGGLFALQHSNPETSHLALSVDTARLDCPIYLQSAAGQRPWRLTDHLDLRVGSETALVLEDSTDPMAGRPQAPGESVEEPPPRALPVDTPLTGDLRLVVDGLPEDRQWEPYVTVALGTARRKHGRRARTLDVTTLTTEEADFVLAPLSGELEVRFARMLPRLPLLGG